MTATQHVDYDALNSLKDVMEDDFGFLIDTFIQDSDARLIKLTELLNTTDSDQIRRTAHSFKGSCSNLGAIRLASLCSNLEIKALSQDFASLSDDLMEIQQEFLLVKKMMLDFLH